MPAMTSYNSGNGPWERTCFGVISAEEGIDLFGRFVQLLLLTEQGGGICPVRPFYPKVTKQKFQL